jgi:hypothetical protein
VDEESQEPQQDETPRFPGQQERERGNRVVAGDGVESGAIWGQREALFGGERPRGAGGPAGPAGRRQDEAGGRRASQEEVSMELGGGPTKAGGTRTNQGGLNHV